MATNALKEKALNFAKECKTAVFCTMNEGIPFTRPMLLVKVDEDFTLWYATSMKSQKIEHLKKSSITSSTLNDAEKSVQVIGNGEIITDVAEKASIWDEAWNPYWPKKEHDPDYGVIKVTPMEVNFHARNRVNKVL